MYTFTLMEEGNPDVFNNMDELAEHDAKWNNYKKTNIVWSPSQNQSRMVVIRGQALMPMEILAKEYTVCYTILSKFLEI